MSDLEPVISAEPDWPVRRLGDVVTLLRRGTAPVYVDDSDVKAIGQRCVTNSDFDASWARPHSARAMARTLKPEVGDVLINSTGTGTIGRSALFGEREGNYIVDGHVTVARPQPTAIRGRWLNDLLRTPAGQRYLETRCYAGSTNQVELSAVALADLLIAVPPLDFQLWAETLLDTLDTTVRTTSSLLAKLNLLKIGLTQAVFADGSAPLIALGEVAEVRNGTTPSRERRDYWERGSVPWVSSGKVNDYRITAPSELVTERAVGECHLRILPAGSVLVGMIGQGKTRGMAARLDIAAAINQNLAGIVPGPRLLGAYLHHYLVHSYQKLRSGGRGSNQDALTTGLVAQFQVPVPPIEEQRRVADLLDALDLRIASERRIVAKLTAEKEGLLADLLSGRVRVPAEVSS